MLISTNTGDTCHRPLVCGQPMVPTLPAIRPSTSTNIVQPWRSSAMRQQTPAYMTSAARRCCRREASSSPGIGMADCGFIRTTTAAEDVDRRNSSCELAVAKLTPCNATTRCQQNIPTSYQQCHCNPARHHIVESQTSVCKWHSRTEHDLVPGDLPPPEHGQMPLPSPRPRKLRYPQPGCRL